jgi:ribose transport system permease protein
VTSTSTEQGIQRFVRRSAASRGLITVVVALVLLMLAGRVFAPTSVSKGALLGSLPFGAVLAIAALGQTLVVMQGGIDLSIAGSISVTIVIVTHDAYGDNDKVLPAVLAALGVTILAGLLNGFLIGRLGLNAIVATLGTNALLYSIVLGVSGGTPRQTTTLLASVCGGTSLGIPNSVYFAVGAAALTTLAVKRTVIGRRFEAVGANAAAARTTGLKVQRHRAGGYVWAQVLYCLAGVLLAGILNKPTAYQGDGYLLPSVAAVVLGGTSLLGGRGNLIASALAALFLNQLQQFVLALGVTFAVQTLVQAAALTIGVALYTVNWSAFRRLFAGRAMAPAT